jgi:hypothetical protein
MDIRFIYKGHLELLHVAFLFRLLFDVEEGEYVLPKRRLTFNGLHGIYPEDRTLNIHRCEDLKSNMSLYFDMCTENML